MVAVSVSISMKEKGRPSVEQKTQAKNGLGTVYRESGVTMSAKKVRVASV